MWPSSVSVISVMFDSEIGVLEALISKPYSPNVHSIKEDFRQHHPEFHYREYNTRADRSSK